MKQPCESWGNYVGNLLSYKSMNQTELPHDKGHSLESNIYYIYIKSQKHTLTTDFNSS